MEQKYLVIKMTKQMEKDLEECERMACENKDKDCTECSLNGCLADGKIEVREAE